MQGSLDVSGAVMVCMIVVRLMGSMGWGSKSWRCPTYGREVPKGRTFPRLERWLIAVSLLFASCRSPEASRKCPASFAVDHDRARRLADRLEASAEGARLAAHVCRDSGPTVCFGKADISTITTEGVILFDERLSESEGAARLGHLVLHFVEGLPMSKPRPTDCETQVERALQAEARALSLEIRLRRELDVRDRRLVYEFEEPYWAAGLEERESLILRYLKEHPNGAPGLDALAAGYMKRCRDAAGR
jgi:hypothetical protein